MADETRPHLGPAGWRLAEPPVRGEPNGPRPPILEVVDAPARAIEGDRTTEQRSNVAESTVPPHTAGPDVAIRGFHGGVEHSQEMRAARRSDAVDVRGEDGRGETERPKGGRRA